MTLSVSITPQAEATLKERAAAAGKDPTAYASELLETAIGKSELRSPSPVGESIYDALEPILREAWALYDGSPRAPMLDEESEVDQILVEKFRKQGLRL